MRVRLAAVAAAVVVLWSGGFGAVPGQASVLSGIGSPGHAVSLPSDQGSDGQWWFTSWQIGEVWDTGARGQGVTVAVIDSGVQADRSELQGVVLPGAGGPSGDGRTDTESEKGGHGTHMAVLIAGQGGSTGMTGVAPEAKILPVVDQGNLAARVRWAVDHGAKVVNMSIGAPGGGCAPEEAEAVRYAIEKGAILVAGMGNERTSGNPSNVPANCPGVVAVGAVNSVGQVWERSNTGPYASLAAPGVHMVTVRNDGRQWFTSGTSDSTALVSGVMALVWSAHPELSNRQVVARVLATAADVGPAGRDEETGFGVARPLPAITADVPDDAPNPVFDAVQPSAEPSASGTAGSDGSGGPAGGAGSGGDPGSGSGSSLMWVGAGVGGVTLTGLVVLLVVVIARRNKAVPHPAVPGAYPSPGQYPPSGYPPSPHQGQGPYPGQGQGPYPSQGRGPNPGQGPYPGQGQGPYPGQGQGPYPGQGQGPNPG
jgi:subtilisin family serine protease